MARLFVPDGPIANELDQLQVVGDSSVGTVKVKAGKAWVQGHYYETDAQLTKAIASAHATLPRIDRVVVRADFVNNNVVVAVLTGAANASPVAPTLTQSTSIWEVSLARVQVNANDNVIAPGNVTDERKLASPWKSFVGCRLGRTATRVMTDAALASIEWDLETYDTHGLHDNVTNNTRITIPSGLGGFWRFRAQFALSNVSAAVQMRAELAVTGSPVATREIRHASVGNTPFPSVSVEAIWNMAVGNFITAALFQKSGASQTLVEEGSYTHFEAQYLGA